ncbi:basic phospholipase A2 PA-9C-like [Carcharodon carcharias]|uniref:basic phospholipase A2 PA-9C-like n=1 Tax=Carcharodon carcharias TaxID=13397 RepID=UPI001B7DAF2D|nr:basic phospholipase A2 PA-9C-like [Carcharodon carcharias]
MKITFQTTLTILHGVLLTVAAHGRWKRHLDQLGSMIECRVGTGRWLSRLDYFDYGCYCGFGGQGVPLDAVDWCCKQHDVCYGRIDSEGLCHWYQYPYWTHYSWSCDPGRSLMCTDPKDTCGRAICKCDKNLVDCFSKSKYNPGLKGIDKTQLC